MSTLCVENTLAFYFANLTHLYYSVTIDMYIKNCKHCFLAFCFKVIDKIWTIFAYLLICRMAAPSYLLANQNLLRASCYVFKGNLLCLHVQQSNIQKQIFGFYIHQKHFFRKTCHDHNVCNGTSKNFIKKSPFTDI